MKQFHGGRKCLTQEREENDLFLPTICASTRIEDRAGVGFDARIGLRVVVGAHHQTLQVDVR